jgi:hypothetical protein
MLFECMSTEFVATTDCHTDGGTTMDYEWLANSSMTNAS